MRRLLLALPLLLPACGPAPAPAPSALPGPADAVADLRHGVAAQEGPGPAAAPRRKPLPPRPRDEAERLRGLLHLLEWGDKDLVLFAQRVLAEHPDPAAVAAAVAKAGEANLRVNLPYVGNLLGAVADERAGRAMEGFLLACLDCGDPSVREKALRIYARSLPEKALPVVAARCTDHWPRTAQAALRELETRPGAEASAALREAFPRVSTFARASACATLGRLGDPASIPILAEAMEDARRRGDNEVTVFLGAAEGLAALGDARGVEALRACVRALPPQRPAVPMDFPREQWGGPEAALARLHDGVLRDRLLMQARRAPPEAAAAALRLLSTEYPADPEILGAYRAALERADGDFVLWAEALAALRAAGNADALARTLAALESPELDRRYAATLALGRFRDPSTVKPLVDRLGREQDPGVARKICDALGLLGDPAAAPALVKFLREDPSPTPDRAYFAFEAQGNLRGAVGAAAVEDLVALLEGRTSLGVRFHAARALGHAGGPRARAALEAVLKDPEPCMRTAAADALGEIGDAAARDSLAGAYAREPDDGAAEAERDAILRVDLRNP